MDADASAGLRRVDASVSAIAGKVRRAPAERRIEEIDALSAEDGFWNDQKAAEKLMRERGFLSGTLEELDGICAEALDLNQLAATAKDPGLIAEVGESIAALAERAEKAEIAVLFDGEHDSGNAILEIKSGAGGDDACDWATMLARMYCRWADANGFKFKLLSWFPGGQGDGAKLSTWRITGERAYGWLKPETGVHRLVRLSPFDSSNSRHTSFCSVSAIPEVDDSIEIDLRKADVRVETFRAQGPGGQHRNTTDSAVRMTHVPTGITATSTEKSQGQNREIAMKTLRARLHALEMEKRCEEAAKIREAKGDAGWGNQIRSYVLHPYKMVKDHRTGMETSSADGVLDGDLGHFMKAALTA